MKPAAGLLLTTLVAVALAPAARSDPPSSLAALRPVDPENLLVVETSKGRVIVELEPQVAPAHVARIRKLARKGWYDANVFYRVIPGAFAQTGEKTVGGDPVSGEGLLKSEASFVPPSPPVMVDASSGFIADMPVAVEPGGRAHVRYCPGMAALAHYDSPDSGDSQVFFTVSDAAYLEAQFTAWGRIVSGEDVLRTLAPGEPPASPDRVLRARIAADMPAAERPTVAVAAAGTRAFQVALDAARKAWGPALTICRVALPAEVR